MTTKLIDKGNGVYACGNCMMRQPGLQENCFWCGNLFYNYMDLLIKESNEKLKGEIKDESNIHGRD